MTEEQKENEINLTVLTGNIEKLQKIMEDLKSKKSYLDYEFQDLTNKRALLQAELDKRQREERERIMPQLEQLNQKLKYLNEEILDNTKEIEKHEKQIELLTTHKAEVETMLEKIKDDHEKIQEEYIMARQKPLNINKMLQGDDNGMEIVDEELKKLKARNEELKEKINISEEAYMVLYFN